MKSLLSWAILAIALVAWLYFGVLAVGATPVGSIVLVMGVFMGVSALSPNRLSGAFLVATTTALFTIVAITSEDKHITWVVLSVVFSGAWVTYTSTRSKLGAFLVCQVECLGIYGTLALSAWWPAAIAVVILGVWWFILHVAERIEKITPAAV